MAVLLMGHLASSPSGDLRSRERVEGVLVEVVAAAAPSTLARDRRQGRDCTVTSESPDARQPTLIGPAVRVRVFQDVDSAVVHGHTGGRPRPLRLQDGLDLPVRRDLQEAMTACGNETGTQLDKLSAPALTLNLAASPFPARCVPVSGPIR